MRFSDGVLHVIGIFYNLSAVHFVYRYVV